MKRPARWRLLTLGAAAQLLLVAGCGTSPSGTPEPTPTPTARTVSRGDWWQPKAGATFAIQYSGRLDLDQDVDVYNLDGADTSAEQVASLTSRGVAVVCYFNAGAWEEWRADADAFPAEVIGTEMDGWAGERWLDIRAIDQLLPIMTARMDTCKEKGFVGVDPDNTDGFIQDTGFEISPEDQIAYQQALAREAHARGLAIGLKNNPDQLPDLADDVDFAVNEECVKFHECGKYADFLASDKPVFQIEYEGTLETVCPGRPEGMSTLIKDLKLGAETQSC